VGPTNDDHRLVTKYREFLEWDIMTQPWSTQIAEKVLSPVLGKSIVFYGHKPPAPAASQSVSDTDCSADGGMR
jgi:hypothetical protein